MELTQETLKSKLLYCPLTGVFVWKDCGRMTHLNGTVAGWTHTRDHSRTNYRRIRINFTIYPAHRLAWLYMNGKFPDDQIDHIDSDGTNNAINNLRDVDAFENNKNRRKSRSNTSGVVGVSWSADVGRWKAQIRVNNRLIYLGRHKDIKDAIKARKAANIKYGFHPNHGKDRLL